MDDGAGIALIMHEVECMFVFSTVNHFTFLPVLYSLEKKIVTFVSFNIYFSWVYSVITYFVHCIPGCCSGLLLVAVVACK